MPTRSSLVARCGAALLLAVFAAACSSGAASTPAGAQGPTLAAGSSSSITGSGSPNAAGTTGRDSSVGSGSGSGDTAAGSSASAPITNPAGSSQGTLDGVPKTCPPADEVMSNLHLSSLVLDGGDPSICQYLFNGSQTAPYAVVTFTAPAITPAAFEAGLKSGQSGVEVVPGLADAAFTFTVSGGGNGLSFLSGSTVCSIVTTVPTTTAGEISLARALLAG